MLGAEPVQGFLEGASDIGPNGGSRLPRGDGIGSRGRRRSVFVLISAGQIFLSLLAWMKTNGCSACGAAQLQERDALARIVCFLCGVCAGRCLIEVVALSTHVKNE